MKNLQQLISFLMNSENIALNFIENNYFLVLSINVYADVILDEEEGRPNRLAIVDYKTSTDEHRAERYAKQLTIYAAAGRQEGLEVDACYVHELKTSGRKPVDVGEENTSDAVNWAAKRFGEIASGLYPAKAKQNNCEKCDFKLVCAHSCVRD